MPFQPKVRYTYTYLKGEKRFHSSNKSSELETNANGKWVTFQHTFPVDTNQNYVRYSWIDFDSSQCPVNNIGSPISPISIALPSSIWGSKAGIFSNGWVKIYFSTYLKPTDSVEFNIHAALNQDFVYKPATGATARIAQKSWINMITQVADSAIKFVTSDNQTFWLSKWNGFFVLPSLGETCPEWKPLHLDLVATQSLPGVDYYKKKAKDLFTWQVGDTIGYISKDWGNFTGPSLNYQYWFRFSILERQELNNGDSVRFTVQKDVLKRSYNIVGQPFVLFPSLTETVVIGYPAWADTVGNTFGPVSNFEGGFGFSWFGESASFKSLILGSIPNFIDHQPVELINGRRVFSFTERSRQIDTCPAPVLHEKFIIDGGGQMSSFSEGFGQISSSSSSVMGFGNTFELDCYKMNGSGTGCTPLLVLSAKENLTTSQWKVFPNPGKDKLNISGDGWKTITFRDLQGKQVLNIAEKEYNSSFNVNQLRAGLYFISIRGNGRQVQQMKWVKE